MEAGYNVTLYVPSHSTYEMSLSLQILLIEMLQESGFCEELHLFLEGDSIIRCHCIHMYILLDPAV